MIVDSVIKTHLKLHFIILVLALTGIVGAIVTISSVTLVWWRMIVALLCLGALVLYKKTSLKIGKTDGLKILGAGVLVAGHWLLFFESIKVSNVSVALACFATTSLFASLLEPIFYKRKIIGYEVIFGVIIILGLYIIFRFETHYVKGMIYAVISAFLDVLFVISNGKFIRKNDAHVITLYEMTGGILVITSYMILTSRLTMDVFSISLIDIGCIVFLGVICTAYAFVLTVDLMREVTPFTMAVSFNLEPVYSILFAVVIFGEKEYMTWGFYAGTALILITVFLNAYLKRKKRYALAQ